MDSRTRPCSIRLVRISSSEKEVTNATVHLDSRTCDKSFKTKSSLNTRKRKQTKIKRRQCAVCNQWLCSKSKLNEHFKRIHSETKRFPCTQCPSSFDSLNPLSRHIRVNHDPSYSFSVKCSVCDKYFSNNCVLNLHIRIHTNEKPYSCSVCGKHFSMIQHLKEHLKRIHAKVKVKPHTCIICEKRFYNLGSLMDHVHSHTQEKPYSCTVCGSSFGRKDWARKHLLLHSVKRPFSCTECALAFHSKLEMLRHSLKDHTEKLSYHKIPVNTLSPKQPKKRNHKCVVCHKLFLHLGHLNVHMLNHTGELPFKCETCAKSFRSKPNLQKHKLVHTRQKTYRCSQCTRSYQGLKSLYQHITFVHEGVKAKTVECKICHKLFYWNCDLVRHMRVHTGETPYQCVFCEKGFGDESNLYTHIRLNHTRNEKPYFCKKCPFSFSHSSQLKQHIRKVHQFRSPR